MGESIKSANGVDEGAARDDKLTASDVGGGVTVTSLVDESAGGSVAPSESQVIASFSHAVPALMKKEQKGVSARRRLARSRSGQVERTSDSAHCRAGSSRVAERERVPAVALDGGLTCLAPVDATPGARERAAAEGAVVREREVAGAETVRGRGERKDERGGEDERVEEHLLECRFGFVVVRFGGALLGVDGTGLDWVAGGESSAARGTGVSG